MSCVLLIAVLWGGGLGMLLPGLKVLISEEGLHGWAWSSLTGDKIDANIVMRMVPEGTKVPVPSVGGAESDASRQTVSFVIDVVSIQEDGRADKARLKQGEWLIGLYDPETGHQLVRADALAHHISDLPTDDPIWLSIYSPSDKTIRAVEIEPSRAGLAARIFGAVARLLPVPKDYADRFRVLLWLSIVTVGFTLGEDKVVISVADEGEGFDPDSVPDPTLDENLGIARGRGLVLMRAYMDSVQFNRVGNKVTMTKLAPWHTRKTGKQKASPKK